MNIDTYRKGIYKANYEFTAFLVRDYDYIKGGKPELDEAVIKLSTK